MSSVSASEFDLELLEVADATTLSKSTIGYFSTDHFSVLQLAYFYPSFMHYAFLLHIW